MIGWRQGEWVSLPDGAEVSALVPGPSLFETFALRAGRIACLADHLDRLALGCPRLGLDPTRLMLGADTSVARWTAPLGSLGANDIFVEFTDDTGAPGSCDEASEVAALLTAGASGGTQFNASFDFQRDEVVLFLHDRTDGYLWHWSEAALGDGNVDASELTLLVKLVGVTDITNGDLAVYV